MCVFRGHSTEDFISLPSSSSSEVLSALISLPPEALPREKRRVREIAGVLPHHPRNIDCLITVALQPIINTIVVMEAEKEEWSRRQHCSVSKRGYWPLKCSSGDYFLKCSNSYINVGFLEKTHQFRGFISAAKRLLYHSIP